MTSSDIQRFYALVNQANVLRDQYNELLGFETVYKPIVNAAADSSGYHWQRAGLSYNYGPYDDHVFEVLQMTIDEWQGMIDGYLNRSEEQVDAWSGHVAAQPADTYPEISGPSPQFEFVPTIPDESATGLLYETVTAPVPVPDSMIVPGAAYQPEMAVPFTESPLFWPILILGGIVLLK